MELFLILAIILAVAGWVAFGVFNTKKSVEPTPAEPKTEPPPTLWTKDSAVVVEPVAKRVSKPRATKTAKPANPKMAMAVTRANKKPAVVAKAKKGTAKTTVKK